MACSSSPETKSFGTESKMKPKGAPCIQPVWPVKTSSVRIPAARQASSRKRAVVRLPSAQSVPSTAMRGAPTVRILPSQKWRSRAAGGPAHVADRHALLRGGGGERGVVGQKLVEPVDDRHAGVDRLEKKRPQARRHPPAGRGDAHDAEVGLHGEGLERPGDRGVHGDAAAHAVEHLAGVAPGHGRVDHGEDLVAVGAADQAVSGLAARGREQSVADDDRGPIHRGAFYATNPGRSAAGVNCRGGVPSGGETTHRFGRARRLAGLRLLAFRRRRPLSLQRGHARRGSTSSSVAIRGRSTAWPGRPSRSGRRTPQRCR